ncbi:hypothetical protein TSAR_003208 [Trichomalopsis sarcophagae]|uniref:Protein FAM114A2 n=1 Tax=Trichomalopsis sarcophagae TaxID=543379 RepID=A0A232F605_9HYME|nr:hypothetical protein TSAR_003208 [Trichomalopsis sarcophagae]
MATSESDDFESADEELNARTEQAARSKRYTSIGSDSDDDVDYIPVQYHTPMKGASKKEYKSPLQARDNYIDKADDKSAGQLQMETNNVLGKSDPSEKNSDGAKNKVQESKNLGSKAKLACETDATKMSKVSKSAKSEVAVSNMEKPKTVANRRERPHRQQQRKPKEVQSLGAKKLGAIKIDKLPEVETTPDEVRRKAVAEGKPPPLIQECWEEFDETNLQEELRNAELKSQKKNKALVSETTENAEDLPEELKSNLTFKDIFKPDGWEGLGEDVELPDDLTDDKYHPVLDKLTTNSIDNDSANSGWGGWGNWGVSSFINTATAGVSTLTNHVTQGLSLLEETIGVPDPQDLVKTEIPSDERKKKPSEKTEEKQHEGIKEIPKESPSQYLPSAFGFGNFMSSMSSITKLVESTSNTVISGGLDTLEKIGKKTMEVLQEGDPGLKKKRAFFLNEADKPILSQILREAKEKADVEEKSAEEKQQARKVHFESLFDDYQGLVHLEALEMLSKQCNMKIQQQLVNLDGSELTSMQETLDEVKELCDLGDEDDEDEGEEEKDLKEKLQEACKDLGVSLTYDKLIDIWNDINSQMQSLESKEISSRELFQKAISSLAQFTAYSVERFHKTAEFLLIKERRSTVNEADSLVQLTKTLSAQIGFIANLYCDQLNKVQDETQKSENKSSITTIFLEVTPPMLVHTSKKHLDC